MKFWKLLFSMGWCMSFTRKKERDKNLFFKSMLMRENLLSELLHLLKIKTLVLYYGLVRCTVHLTEVAVFHVFQRYSSFLLVISLTSVHSVIFV